MISKGIPLNAKLPPQYSFTGKVKPQKTYPNKDPDYMSDPPVGGYNPEQVALGKKKAIASKIV